MSQHRTFRRATPADYDAILDLIQLCARELMVRHAESPWLSFDRTALAESAASREIFVLRGGDNLAATFTLAEDGGPIPDHPAWKHPATASLYGSKLAVHPDYY